MADTEKYLKLARLAREEENAEDARKYYDMVRTEDPENAEAKFFYSYYRIMDGTKGEAYNNFVSLCNSISSTLSLLSVSNESDAEKKALLRAMVAYLWEALDVAASAELSVHGPDNNVKIHRTCIAAAESIVAWCEKEYGNDSDALPVKYLHLKNKATHGMSDYRKNAEAAYALGDEIEGAYSSDPALMEIAVDSWKYAIATQLEYRAYFRDKARPQRYAEKIQKYNPGYQLPAKSGCMGK